MQSEAPRHPRRRASGCAELLHVGASHGSYNAEGDLVIFATTLRGIWSWLVRAASVGQVLLSGNYTPTPRSRNKPAAQGTWGVCWSGRSTQHHQNIY
eukprot:gene11302-biopygen2656